MFYAMIKAKRDEWLLSDSYTIKSLIYYIEKNGQMRDAQIDAIKRSIRTDLSFSMVSRRRISGMVASVAIKTHFA